MPEKDASTGWEEILYPLAAAVWRLAQLRPERFPDPREIHPVDAAKGSIGVAKPEQGMEEALEAALAPATHQQIDAGVGLQVGEAHGLGGKCSEARLEQ